MVFQWLKNAGQKIWGGIRSGARWLGDTGLKVGRKIVDVAKPIIEQVADVIPYGNVIKKGLGVVEKVVKGGERIKEKSDEGGVIGGLKQGVDEYKKLREEIG